MTKRTEALGRMMRKWGRGALSFAILAAAGCVTPAAVVEAPSLSDAAGYEGRIRLTRFLDEPDGYCLDVPGPVHALRLDLPMVAHTCHPDPLGDQVFQFNLAGEGLVRWKLEEHDLCLTAHDAAEMSPLSLRACDQPDLQTFEYTDRGEFQLSGGDLCVHVERRGPASFQPVEEGQDAYGRGVSINPQFTHLLRRLELRACGDGDPAMSRWRAITP